MQNLSPAHRDHELPLKHQTPPIHELEVKSVIHPSRGDLSPYQLFDLVPQEIGGIHEVSLGTGLGTLVPASEGMAIGPLPQARYVDSFSLSHKPTAAPPLDLPVAAGQPGQCASLLVRLRVDAGFIGGGLRPRLAVPCGMSYGVFAVSCFPRRAAIQQLRAVQSSPFSPSRRDQTT
jgi:hypothetical protein